MKETRPGGSRLTQTTSRPLELRDFYAKSTYRPAVLLRTNPVIAAAAAAAARASSQPNDGKYRNFNDLWVRLENGAMPQNRS